MTTMFEDQTKDAILDRMLETVPEDLDKRQGSIPHDMMSPAAIEFALAYIELGGILDKGFADTAFGEYLERRCADMGIKRKPADTAHGYVMFTGTAGTAIGAGQRVSTDSLIPVYFVTTESVTIPESKSVKARIEAEVGGAAGNVGIGSITVTVGNITGVTAVTNTEATIDGVDAESDSDLLDRYIDRVTAPIASGNPSHYRQWAREVSGIRDAKVYPVWNGPGTVKVVLLNSENKTPSADKVTEVAAYIESVRPIGAGVTVVGVKEVPINVVLGAKIASYTTLEAVISQLKGGLFDYLQALAFKDPLVRYTQIQRVTLDIPEIIDYAGLTVNGANANIEIPDDSVAVLGTVTVTEVDIK
ncbi:MAG: baseplate J/gp47 family protein [Bacillota bacterium]